MSCYLQDQDQDSYSPGQVPDHAYSDQGQDTMDPVDPGNVRHEDFESVSDVNRDRSVVEGLIARRVQAAVADVGASHDAF